MPRHIHEESEVALICLLKEGKTAGSTVVFVVMHDSVEAKRLNGQVVADPAARMGKAATVKYQPPLVAKDKTHYVLTYKAIADGEDYKTTDEIHVWPRKGKLTARNEDGSKPLKNFKFKVMQNGAETGQGYKTETDQSVGEFKLDKGAPFLLEAVAPYEFVGAPEEVGGALRDLKSKGKINYIAEFVSPVRPSSGQIKQWVNLVGDPAKAGVDGKGTTVEVTVGFKDDRDAKGVTIADPIGQAGLFVHIQVKFTGPSNKKSLRNSPKTDLLPGLNLSGRTAVKEAVTDPEWSYTGKVEMALAGGVGKFKLELGKAGGDICEVKIGSTAACGDATLTFTNWRKLWYELMAPDFMELESRTLTDGTNVLDFAADGLSNIKAAGDSTCIDFELYKSHSFTEAEAVQRNPGSVMKREFFERTAGPADVYVLTDYSFKRNPKSFDKGKGARGVLIKGCDINLYNDGPGTHPDQDSQFEATTAQADFTFPDLNMYWHPRSAYGNGTGGQTIKSIDWIANIADPAAHKRKPICNFDPNDGSGSESADAASFKITELLQNPTALEVSFTKTLGVGNIDTTLGLSARFQIDAWLAPLWSPAAIKPHGTTLRFHIVGPAPNNERRLARFQAIRDYIVNRVAGHAPEVFAHPGLALNGTPIEGVLPITAVNLTRSHHQRIAIDLPSGAATDPGTLAGAEDATHCPITVNVTWEQQRSANGLASNGEILVKWGIAAPKSITDTMLHEVGHQFGLTQTGTIPGIPAGSASSGAEAVTAYQHNGTNGHYYSGHGHSGTHCAYGLSDAHKALVSYQGRAGSCIMYGEGGRVDSQRTRLSFCVQCQDRMRGFKFE